MSDRSIDTGAGRDAASGSRPARAVQILAVFVWFGLLTGACELCATLIQHLVRGHALFFNQHAIWMMPAAQALLFAGLSIPAVILAACTSRRISLFAAAGFCALVGAYSFCNTLGLLHVAASLLLSVGIAFQVARAADRHPHRFLALVRRTLGWLIAGLVVAGVGLFAYRAVGEAVAVKRLPPPEPDCPNVMLVVLDTVRADGLSVYGNRRAHTPNLQRLASESTVFECALSTSSWTLPSHASMFTGRFPHALSADWFSPLDDRWPTLAEVLRDHGYLTGGFVANTAYCGRPTGLDRGFLHYDDASVSVGELLVHSRPAVLVAESNLGSSCLGIYDHLGRKRGHQVTQECLAWLDRQPRRPFFAFLNYCDAHDPYLPDRLVDEDRPLRHAEKLLMKNWWQMSPAHIGPEQRRLAKACYQSLIHQLDQQIGALMAGLAQRGLRDNTILIVVSDHGEQFGEHGLYYHGNSLYRKLVRVPLLISWPQRIRHGQRVARPVTLRDLPSTVLEMVGIDNAGRLGGNSQAALALQTDRARLTPTSPLFCTVNPNPLADRTAFHRLAPASQGTMYSLLEGGQYLICDGRRRQELYDFLFDTADAENLAAAPDRQEGLRRIAGSLQRVVQSGTGQDDLAVRTVRGEQGCKDQRTAAD